MKNSLFYLVKHYLYSAKRNKGRLLDILIWPLIEIFIFGMTSVYLGDFGEINLLALLVINLAYWHFFSRVANETFQQVFDDVISNNLQNIIIAPVSTNKLILAWVLASLIKFLASLVMMIGFVLLMYRIDLFVFSFDWLVMFFVIILSGLSVGLVVISLLFLFGSKALAFGWVITGLMQPLSCLFYSRQVLGTFLGKISYLIPISYVFERQRLVNLRVSVDGSISYVFPIILSIVYFFISSILLKRAIRYSRKKGIISRI